MEQMKNQDRIKRGFRLCYIVLLCCLSACGEAFLELKPDQSQRIPVNLIDYQAMLDHTDLMNNNSSHVLGIVGSDESYMLDARYETMQTGVAYNYQKRAYTWNQMIYEGGEPSTDWSTAYSRILVANLVLDGLKKLHLTESEKLAFNQVKGSAFFYRSMAFYSLAQLYCKPYDATTANTDLGLPLRLEGDVTLKVNRSTVAQTYQRIIDDLNEAIMLLTTEQKVLYRPSKAAAHALLSRVFLQMSNYTQAGIEAGNAIAFKNTLVDLNKTPLTASYTFPVNAIANPEVLFYSSFPGNITPVSTGAMNIDLDLLASYTGDDLRKIGYFSKNKDGRILFKGSYSGSSIIFTGLAIDEMLLNRAECYARMGKVTEAMEDLNQLAIKRYDKNNFTEFIASTAEQALKLILLERHKELLFRGTRWEDLRRLNKEVQFQKTLSRTIRGQVFQLSPNDVRYVWPLPLEAIASGGYIQNPR